MKKALQEELKAKIKLGIKPSDLKRKAPLTMPRNPEQYLSELEQEKATLLAQLANYQKEQTIAITTFKKQAQSLQAKETELQAKEQELSQQEAEITKLKARIQQLAQAKKEAEQANKFTPELPEPIPQTNTSTQTTGPTPSELEDQLLTKRLTNLQDFSTYRTKLAERDAEITSLENSLAQLQKKLSSAKQLKTWPNPALFLTIAVLFLIIILK